MFGTYIVAFYKISQTEWNLVVLLDKDFGTTTVWPDLAKFRQIGTILKVSGNILRVYLVFGKMLIQLRRKCFTIGQVFIVADGQILSNNFCHLVTLDKDIDFWFFKNWLFLSRWKARHLFFLGQKKIQQKEEFSEISSKWSLFKKQKKVFCFQCPPVILSGTRTNPFRLWFSDCSKFNTA